MSFLRSRLLQGRQLPNEEITYARLWTVEDHLRLGWVSTNALEGTHHGYWSVAMEWICPTCKPLRPGHSPSSKLEDT